MVDYSVGLQESCFPFLEKEEAETLMNVMKRVSCVAGTQIFQKGDPADCLYFIQTGRLAVQNKTGFGEKMQVVALLDPGAPVGEKGLLGQRTRGATLMAVKDSELLALPLDAFDTLINEAPVLAIKLLKWLLNRVSLRLEKSSERLARVL
ncbi:MAG: cyclic nucleotide-binding domain-containing protein [Desulforhopalus sp.]